MKSGLGLFLLLCSAVLHAGGCIFTLGCRSEASLLLVAQSCFTHSEALSLLEQLDFNFQQNNSEVNSSATLRSVGGRPPDSTEILVSVLWGFFPPVHV